MIITININYLIKLNGDNINKLKILLLSLSIVGLVMFSGCIGDTTNNNNNNNNNVELPTLKVGYLPTDHHASLFVAATYPDLFKNDGVYLKEIEPKKKYELYENNKKVANVELVRVNEGGAKIMAFMAQGQVDVGLNGVPPAVFAIDKGTKAKIISAINSEGSAVVVRKDIPVNNWNEFVNYIKEQHAKGNQVKIGHPLPVSIQYVMIKDALTAENITYTEGDDKNAMVKLINCKGQAQMPQLLSSKELDGVIAWEPTPEVIVTKGIGKVIVYSQDLPPKGQWENHPCCVLVASDNAIENKNNAVQAFLKLITISTNKIDNNKSLAIDSSSSWLGVDKEVEERSVPNIKYITNPLLVEEGTINFVKVLNSQNSLTGILKGADDNKIKATMFDNELYEKLVNN